MMSPGEPAQSPGPGWDADILRERDRIASELHNEVIRLVFAIGLHLQATAGITTDTLMRGRVEQAISDLDHLVRIIRDTVFGLEAGLKDRGLRASIVHLCEQLSPVPEITFRGPVDGTLHPAASAELLDILDHALTVLGHRWAPVRIDVTAGDGAHATTLEAVPLPDAAGAGEPDDGFPGLRDRAAQTGMRIDIQPGPERVQITWHAC